MNVSSVELHLSGDVAHPVYLADAMAPVYAISDDPDIKEVIVDLSRITAANRGLYTQLCVLEGRLRARGARLRITAVSHAVERALDPRTLSLGEIGTAYFATRALLV